MNILESIGRFVIPNYLELRVSRFFEKRGIYKTPFQTIGIVFLVTLLVSVLLDIYLSRILFKDIGALHVIKSILLFLALVFVAVFSYVQYYNVINYKRTKEIERVLPDYLSIVSSNLESGMTVNKALWEAATPEFGVLTKEIKLAAKQVTTGQDLMTALKKFNDKYDSLILNRAVDLIIEGIQSGGELAEIINKVVDNIEQTIYLKKEMEAASLSYVIFITIIVTVIAPFLFALSYNLLLVVTKIATRVVLPQGAGGVGGAMAILSSITNISMDPVDFQNFGYLSISIIALFSSMIISIINKEKIIGGLKYIPIFIVVSGIFFWLFSQGLASLFGGFI
ncbi:type II secretion system F family protein [Candidatus Woesearchaeota archaeon]|nr:type II secretion system F family protein [Candidatus Woesearchaeota archaeon]